MRENAVLQIVYKWEFASVIVDTMTILICRGSSVEHPLSIRNRPEEEPLEIEKQQILSTADCVLRGFRNTSTKNLIEKIQKSTSPLKNFAKTTSGFGGKSSAVTSVRKNASQIPVFKGSSINRYVVLEPYYFEFIDENLTGRTRDVRKLGQRIKILLRKTGNRIIATYDESGTFPEQSLYFLYDLAPSINPKFLLGVLNSTLLTWYYRACLVTNIDSTLQIKNYDLDMMPIVISETQNEIAQRVDQVLSIKSLNPAADVTAQEAEIDRLVYGLYGLTAAEIKIVEGQP